MQITIEKNVPLPKPRMRGGVTVYPFPQMEVGDSFALPRDRGQTLTGSCKTQNILSSCARNYAKKHNPEARFSIRLIDENTVRVWRVA